MRSPVLLLIVLAMSGSLFAQATSSTLPQSANSELNVQVLLERIQHLEKRISDLEARENGREAAVQSAALPEGATVAQASPTTTEPEAHTGPTAVPSEHEHPSTAIVREAEEHYPSLQIRGFGDVDFSASDQKGTVSGFNLGQFVLHFASPLSRKVSYFGEVSFTAQPSNYDVQVERTIIR
jgi:hypothetical protein